MEELLEAIWNQNKQLYSAVAELEKMVSDLKMENAEMRKQLELSTLIAKSSCPVFSEEERKGSLFEVMKIREQEKKAEEIRLSTEAIFH